MKKLTDREKQVLAALTDQFEWPGSIGMRAGLRTMSVSETASKFLIRLTRSGLAERTGSRMFPMYRRATGTPTQADREEG